MKTLKFGIEIETVGLGWAELAAAIQRVVGGSTQYIAGGTAVTASDGRTWSVVRDGQPLGLGQRRNRLADPRVHRP